MVEYPKNNLLFWVTSPIDVSTELCVNMNVCSNWETSYWVVGVLARPTVLFKRQALPLPR